MNRSLEALAIFTICLGGILAVVRCSTADRQATESTVAEETKSAPAKNSGSAAEQVAPHDCELAYLEGCGLDRNEGLVYSPLSPLLSPREVALRAIRSQPIPLVILPEAAELADRTGYDKAYDNALSDAPTAEEELSRAELEAEYAAAELAAATEGSNTGVYDSATRNLELTPPSPTWSLISGSMSAFGSDLLHGTRHVQRSYVEPFSRGIENRLMRMPLPTLRDPRAKEEVRRHLLLREQAEANQDSRSLSVTWNDYLGFVGRKLPVVPNEGAEQRVARQKSPRNVLWPR